MVVQGLGMRQVHHEVAHEQHKAQGRSQDNKMCVNKNDLFIQ